MSDPKQQAAYAAFLRRHGIDQHPLPPRAERLLSEADIAERRADRTAQQLDAATDEPSRRRISRKLDALDARAAAIAEAIEEYPSEYVQALQDRRQPYDHRRFVS